MAKMIQSLKVLVLTAALLSGSANAALSERDKAEIGTDNYAHNGGYEMGSVGVSAYADSGSTPTDASGGSPTLTCTTSTSSPISGGKSILITKDAANRQGEGCRIQKFVLDDAGANSRLSVRMTIKIASGSYTNGSDTADSDLTLWVYGPTESSPVMRRVEGYQCGFRNGQIRFYGDSQNCDYAGEFDSGAAGTYYLVTHEALTGTSAFSAKLDNLTISKDKVTKGAVVTQWQSYTPTFTGFGTVNTQDIEWRQNGQNIELRGKFTSGTVTASEARISLPNSYVVDSSVSSDTPLGRASRNNTSASNDFTVLASGGDSYINLGLLQSSGTDPHAAQNANAIIATGDVVALTNVSIPIEGLASGAHVTTSSQFNISSYLGSGVGTRVTSFSTPCKLGEYITKLRNANADTFTNTNGAPTFTPNATDGIRIYNGNAYTSADTNNEPTFYQLCIGPNKQFQTHWWASTGHTGNIDVTPFADSTSNSYGYRDKSYDPNTGILTIQAMRHNSGSSVHVSGKGDASADVNDPYFDVTVSDSVIPVQKSPPSEVYVTGGDGYGSTNTAIRDYSGTASVTGNAISYSRSDAAGAAFTINEDGIYAVSRYDVSAGTSAFGLSKNSNQLTTAISAITEANSLAYLTGPSNASMLIGGSFYLRAGDVIRAHDENGASSSTSTRQATFRITKVGD